MTRLQSLVSPLWISLQYREQVALLIGGMSLLAFIAYVGIARPLIDHKEASARQLTAQEARFERIIGMLARLDPTDRPKAETATGDVRALVLARAQEANITIDRIQSGDARFTLFINDVSATALFGWLTVISNEVNVQPISVTIRKSGRETFVAAQIGFSAINE